MQPHPYLDDPAPIGLAHRGGGAATAENTWSAFTAAVAVGYRYMETDVQVTADGEVVLFHDDDLRRMTGRPERVGELTYAQVCRERIGGRTDQVPRLGDALARWPGLRWNIDLKTEAVIEPFAAVVGAAGALDRVCVASFSDARIARAAALLGATAPPGATVCRSAGRGTVRRLVLRSRLRIPPVLARGPRPQVVQVPVRHSGITIVTGDFVRHMHALGIAVHVWTINTEPEMTALLDLGVDGLVTDEIGLLATVLAKRAG